MYNCETCGRHPCEGLHKEQCKFHPENRLTDFGPDDPSYWIPKQKQGIIVTPEMVEDLLHRNKVDIDYAEKEIERFNERIRTRKELIKRLLVDRAGLFEALKKVKQEWKK
jgi:hypothetical protein